MSALSKLKSFIADRVCLLRRKGNYPGFYAVLYGIAKLAYLPFSLLSMYSIAYNIRKKYSSVHDVDTFTKKFSRIILPSDSRSVDLGCGSRPRNPFGCDELWGIDICSIDQGNILQADLSLERIPFQDSHFDVCTAYDFIEHMPRFSHLGGSSKSPFVELMNEIYRILKPGGLFLHRTPCYPSKQAFTDPTHVNIITEDTFPGYFCEPSNLANKLGYGFMGSFELIEQRWQADRWIICLMKSNKTI